MEKWEKPLIAVGGAAALAAFVCYVSKKKKKAEAKLGWTQVQKQDLLPSSFKVVMQAKVQVQARQRKIELYHTEYHPYHEIVSRLEATAAAHPSVATLRYAGPIAILTLRSQGSEGDKLPQAWIEGGIHPCERIGPTVVMRLLDELLHTPHLLAMAEWHLVPVVEVEGFNITWDTDRWNKGCASGVNPNTNFPSHWGEMDPTLKMLAKVYPELLNIGPEAASEGCVKEIIAELRGKTNLKLFLDFHSFGGRVLYPWGWTLDAPKDRAAHEAATQIAVIAANSIARNWEYKAIAAAAMEAPAGGTVLDFAYGEIGCVHSYCVELPPNFPSSIPKALLRSWWAGDTKLWWKEGMGLADESVLEVGDEMTVAVKALAEHVFKS